MLYELTTRQRKITTVFIGIFTVFLSNILGYFLSGVIALYLLTGKRTEILYSIFASIPRDFQLIYQFHKTNQTVGRWINQNMGAADILEETVEKFPNKSALILGDEKITFKEALKFTNQIASYFHQQGFRKGDCIALLMETRIEYPFIWVGLSKIGVVTALINHTQRKEALMHSIKLVKCKAVIVSSEFRDEISNIEKFLIGNNVKVFHFTVKNEGKTTINNIPWATDLRKEELEKVSIIQKNLKDKNFTVKDTLLYVFTSGTTGLPKAAVITHVRYMYQSLTGPMFNVTANDILYTAMPLYHGAGGMGAIGLALNQGVTVVLRKKFSASNYFTDCIKYNCTVGQYIGEMCRYMLLSPPKPTDKQHKVRLMMGNGIKPQLWTEFQKRFGIGEICEMYGSTEGNCNVFNLDKTPGNVGSYPKCLDFMSPLQIIRCDNDGEPIRNMKGLCIQCQPGESGLLIGKIRKGSFVGDFIGYTDKKATEKKILKNVFKRGDSYFNSGDIFVKDILNYFTFLDRTGENFRWRGENVASLEVEGIINKIIGYKDCIVYGVEVPKCDGKAGVVAIVNSGNKLNLEVFSRKIHQLLPVYAKPVFVRFLSEAPLTGTFKFMKKNLVQEGFDIHVVKDPIYVLNQGGNYVELTEEIYDKIMDGKI